MSRSKQNTTFKVCLVDENLKKIAVRLFGNRHSIPFTYETFCAKVFDLFPELSGKPFTLYWRDIDNDEICVSSNEEFELALESVGEQKVFFIKIKPPSHHSDRENGELVHLYICCDGCDGVVSGYRYKCLVCNDFDLCFKCEVAGVHPEHPMIRIPDPFFFKKIDFYRMMQYFSCFFSSKVGKKHSHHRRRHSHDHSESKKKRKCYKYDFSEETAEESDENRWEKFWHVCSQLVNSILKNMDPSHFHKEETCKGNSGERVYEKMEQKVNSVQQVVMKAFISLLDPLGIDTDVEIRPGSDQKEKTKTEKNEERNDTPTPPSAPPQGEEVRFQTSEKSSETLKQKVEEITKILAGQTMDQTNENDGWVSFEELKRNSEEPQPSSSTGIVNCEEQTRQAEDTKESKNLYPTLKNDQRIPTKK